MTNFKQLLNMAIKKRAEAYCKEYQIDIETAIDYINGATLPSELLLLAIETLIPFSGKDGYAEVNEALEKIRTRLEGVK